MLEQRPAVTNGQEVGANICVYFNFKPSDQPPLQMSGCIIEQVSSYKLLGVHLSHNLSWSIHWDYIVKRARKHLSVLRVLTKSGLPPADLIQVYCSLVRLILEYASPVWTALPNCLVQLVESVQKSALRISFPDCSYESAPVRFDLPTLLSRRDKACRRFISNIKESGFLSHLLPQPTNVAHGYGWGRVFLVLKSALSERTALVILLPTVTIGCNCFFCLLCHV